MSQLKIKKCEILLECNKITDKKAIGYLLNLINMSNNS